MNVRNRSTPPLSWLTDPAVEKEALDFADVRVAKWLAQHAGVEDDAAFRAVTLCLGAACREGSLCLPATEAALSGLLRTFFADTGIQPPDDGCNPDVLARQFLSQMNAGNYSPVLGMENEARPLILWRDRLYFQRHFHAERVIAEGLSNRLQPFPCDPAAARAVLREILEEKPLRSPQSQPLALTQKQKWALAAALRERVFLLSGGPGTGKTALTASLLRALMRLRALAPERIRLCAPTGRAAQRLQESLRASLHSLSEPGDADMRLLQIPVETLHRMLGYHIPTGRFARNPDDPLQADLVLLDEASMADAFILSALIRALPPEAVLILVGDADQLPAVESGSILSELSPASRRPGLRNEGWKWVTDCFPESAPDETARFPLETVPTVVLDRSHRAQQFLLDFAEAINTGDVETALHMPRIDAEGGDFAAALPRFLQDHAESLFLKLRIRDHTYVEWLKRAAESPEDGEILSALMEFPGRERILACARHGGLGCVRINDLLRRRLQPVFEKGFARGGEGGAFHGAPILITRNDARTGLSNGEIGVWLRRGALFTACFPRNGAWLRLPMAFLPPWEPAFATTVHKSQGSECDAVLLVLPEAGNRLLTREILYTAVTRARKSVQIFGSEAALREALGNRVHRHSGLREYFKEG